MKFFEFSVDYSLMTEKTSQKELILLLVIVIVFGITLSGLKMYDDKTKGIEKLGQKIYGSVIKK